MSQKEYHTRPSYVPNAYPGRKRNNRKAESTRLVHSFWVEKTFAQLNFVFKETAFHASADCVLQVEHVSDVTIFVLNCNLVFPYSVKRTVTRNVRMLSKLENTLGGGKLFSFNIAILLLNALYCIKTY